MFFIAPSSIPARHVACRMSMLVGCGEPLAWEDPTDPCAPLAPCITQSKDGMNIWQIGADFTLTECSKSEPNHIYQLTHPELSQELEGMRLYVEWVFARWAALIATPVAEQIAKS